MSRKQCACRGGCGERRGVCRVGQLHKQPRLRVSPHATPTLARGFPPHFPQVFLAIFTLELVVKVVALGFVRGKGAYLRDPVGYAFLNVGGVTC